MTGLEKCCITSAYLQWLCHSGERPVARGPLVPILKVFPWNSAVKARTTDHDLCLSCIYSQAFLLHCFFPKLSSVYFRALYICHFLWPCHLQCEGGGGGGHIVSLRSVRQSVPSIHPSSVRNTNGFLLIPFEKISVLD